MKEHLTKHMQNLTYEPEVVQTYWQQCQIFDTYSTNHFIDSTADEQKSIQAFLLTIIRNNR